MTTKEQDIQTFYKQVRILTSKWDKDTLDWVWRGAPKEFNEQFLGVMRGAMPEVDIRTTIITPMGSICSEFGFVRFDINEITLGTGTVLNISRCERIELSRTNQWWIDLYLVHSDVKVLITIPMSSKVEEMVKDIII